MNTRADTAGRAFLRAVIPVLIVTVSLLLFGCGERKTVTVILDPAGGVLSGPVDVTFYEGETPVIPEPLRAGYTFVSWLYPDDWERQGGILVAEWRQNPVSVIFDLDGGMSSRPELAVQLILPGEDAAEPPDVEKEGCIFCGWSGSFQNVTGDTVVHAIWKMEDIGGDEISLRCAAACLEIFAYDYSDIPIALGSGFLVSGDGKVVTAAHVIKGSAYINAVPYGGETYRVTDVLFCDYSKDIAVLQTEIKDARYLELLTYLPDEVDRVYTIGSPNGRTGEQAEGSFIRTTDDYGRNMIATTLELEGGSSGSPLLDSIGRVIGVNVAKSGVMDEALAVPASDIPAEYPDAVTVENFAAICHASSSLMDEIYEREPNDIPERAQIPEENKILRGNISGIGDVDCYSFENISSYRICISVPAEYYGMAKIKLYSPDGKFSHRTWVVDGLSGNYKLYYAQIESEKPVTVFLDVAAAASATFSGLAYSVQGVLQ